MKSTTQNRRRSKPKHEISIALKTTEDQPVAADSGDAVCSMAWCGAAAALHVSAGQDERHVPVVTGRPDGFIHAATSSNGGHPSLLNSYHVAASCTGCPYSADSTAEIVPIVVRSAPTVKVVRVTVWAAPTTATMSPAALAPLVSLDDLPSSRSIRRCRSREDLAAAVASSSTFDSVDDSLLLQGCTGTESPTTTPAPLCIWQVTLRSSVTGFKSTKSYTHLYLFFFTMHELMSSNQ